MYLIHWPVRLTEMVRKTPVPVEIVKPLDIKGAWKGMEECVNLGLTKAIGVSNFSIKTLDQLLSTAKIPPTLNQVLHLIFHITNLIYILNFYYLEYSLVIFFKILIILKNENVKLPLICVEVIICTFIP